MRTFSFVVERDGDIGLYVGYVPGWPGAHSQGASLDELQKAREVAALLEHHGFVEVRQRGSHRQVSPMSRAIFRSSVGEMSRPGWNGTVVPRVMCHPVDSWSARLARN